MFFVQNQARLTCISLFDSFFGLLLTRTGAESSFSRGIAIKNKFFVLPYQQTLLILQNKQKRYKPVEIQPTRGQTPFPHSIYESQNQLTNPTNYQDEKILTIRPICMTITQTNIVRFP